VIGVILGLHGSFSRNVVYTGESISVGLLPGNDRSAGGFCRFTSKAMLATGCFTGISWRGFIVSLVSRGSILTASFQPSPERRGGEDRSTAIRDEPGCDFMNHRFAMTLPEFRHPHLM
jgi:hypothetical protein